MTRRLRRAARWAERLEAGAAGETPARLRAWLSVPANAVSLDRVLAARAAAAALASDERLVALRDAAVRRAEARQGEGGGLSHHMLAAAASMMLVAGVSAAVWTVGGSKVEPAPERTAAAAFETIRGERRALRLPDGSRLVLDTSTLVRSSFGSRERRLVIERGQAFVNVARDPARPFVVEARGHRVVALGTRFNVRLDPGRLQVALLEGKVRVTGSRTGDVTLRPDEILAATSAGTRVLRDPVATAASTSWTVGRLVFRDAPLSQAVAEMNRYAAVPLVLGDGTVGGIRISGSFRAGATEPFVQALLAGFPVRLRRLPDRTVLLADGRS